ncbi:MAG: Uma2 family endonuclease [Chloroflexi bacterium]|nr:Uma2 family endonuclease [Chloroflexota bacterium]
MTTISTTSKPDATGITKAASVIDETERLFPVALRLPDSAIAEGVAACEDWFWEVCTANQDRPWSIELNGSGELELMPTYAYGERREFRLVYAVETWNIANDNPGMTTGPSAAYFMSNGAIRGPDAAWTPNENIVPPRSEPPRTWPFCPDFIAEARSDAPSSIDHLLEKMREYMENGARLGWLIDPMERTVRVYRAGVDEPELLTEPETLDGEEVLPGFTFAVRELIFDLN